MLYADNSGWSCLIIMRMEESGNQLILERRYNPPAWVGTAVEMACPTVERPGRSRKQVKAAWMLRTDLAVVTGAMSDKQAPTADSD
jgi:hypothetical protein